MVQTAVSFGYTSSWLAVGDRPAAIVADALGLRRTRPVSWSDGVRIAYADGVLITPAVSGWTLVVAARMPVLSDPSSAGFPDWLARLSRRLGLVHHFATHRVVELQAWARAVHGVLDRAYCCLGETDTVLADLGARTPEEAELGIGRPFGHQGDRHDPPDENDVMRLAGRWSVDPSRLDGFEVPGTCLAGHRSSASRILHRR